MIKVIAIGHSGTTDDITKIREAANTSMQETIPALTDFSASISRIFNTIIDAVRLFREKYVIYNGKIKRRPKYRYSIERTRKRAIGKASKYDTIKL